MAKNDRPTRVLILRFSALGDVAMTIPVLYPACRANPDVEFYVATQTWPAGMFLDRPANLHVVDVDIKDRYKGVAGMWRLAEKLKRHYGIDAVADLHSVIRTWAIDSWMKMHGVPVARINKERDQRKQLLSHNQRRPLTLTHERYRRVLRNLGLEAPEKGFTRLFDGKPLPHSQILPDKQPGDIWIAVAPFSSHKSKTYPMGLMAQVVGELHADPRVHVFLLGGGKQEKLILRPLHKKLKNVISLAETKHGFADEFALLGQCDLMVTMDSANMHLAALMALPTVTVWGATHPYCGFVGYHHNTDHDVMLDLKCRPCAIYGENECHYGDCHCLSNIPPSMIMAQVHKVLQSQGIDLKPEQK